MPKSQRLIVATVCALLAGAVTFFFQYNRDVIFENRWHESHGNFDPKEDKALFDSALVFAEGEMRGATCVAEWIGKDERYAYLTLGCGRFRREGAKILVTGDQNYIPVRMRIGGAEVTSAERADLNALENSVRRLFPREAASLIAVRMNPALYRERGLAKRQAREPGQPVPAKAAPIIPPAGAPAAAVVPPASAVAPATPAPVAPNPAPKVSPAN